MFHLWNLKEQKAIENASITAAGRRNRHQQDHEEPFRPENVNKKASYRRVEGPSFSLAK